jgi:actin-related protein
MTLTMLSPEFVREIATETFRIPAFYGASRAAVALYAAGVTSGIAVDSGDTDTVVILVYQSFAMAHYAARIDGGRRHINDILQKGLVDEGHRFSSTAERECLSDMKEQLSFVSSDVAKQESISDKSL